MPNYNRKKENLQALKTKKRKKFRLNNYLTNIYYFLLDRHITGFA